MTGENGPAEEFSVLGATANVYSVSVGKHPNCSCPDFQKGNLCKHYLFVMLRVLRLDRSDPLVWQKALLKSEVLHTSITVHSVLVCVLRRQLFMQQSNCCAAGIGCSWPVLLKPSCSCTCLTGLNPCHIIGYL